MTRPELLERYQALPLPTTRDEAWRFTDLKDFDPDSFGHDPSPGLGTGPAETMLEIAVSGLAHVSESSIQIERAPEGVTFAPLVDHPRLHELVGWDEKFAAHNAALWEYGLLVVVPRDTVLDEPLYVRIANAAGGGSLFWRLLVVAEAGSRFSLIEEYASARPDTAGYSNAVVELCVERDAELDWVAGGFGSKKGKIRIQNDLAGPGATSRVTGAYFADGSQHLDYDTFQEHAAPHTTSDFAFKGALRDAASVVWRGMIRVEEEAQRTNAYQENRNLLLSEKAHADSIPGLEILANDVRCTHGATLAQVDREQLFYLMSRGLSRSEAERLIVRGFFQDVLDRIELEPVRETLAEALEARIPQT